MSRLAARIDRGRSLVGDELAEVAAHVERLREISATIDPETGSCTDREERFNTLAASLRNSSDEIHQHMAKTMASFAPGLFAGGDKCDLPVDNLEIERFFRLPKGHERRINGHAHAGVRIVQRGGTLVLVLDAHRRHPDPFTAEDLAPWLGAKAPSSQQECLRRRGIMRRARSSKQRTKLLAELEAQYRRAIPAT